MRAPRPLIRRPPVRSRASHADPLAFGTAPHLPLSIGILFTVTLLLILLLTVLLTVPATAAETHASPPPTGATGPTEGPRICIEFVGDPTASRQRRLKRWLPAYREEMPPLLEAVAALRESLESGSPPSRRGDCRALARALAALDRDALLPAPEFAVHRHLTAALHRLTRAAAACLARRASLAPELELAGRDLVHFAAALRRLGVEP